MLNPKSKKNLLIFLLISFLLLVIPIIPVKGHNLNLHWPTDDMYEYIEDHSLDVHSVIIVRNGYIISEEYLHNSQIRDVKEYYGGSTLHVQYSTTKSLTALIIGIAIDKGYLNNINQTLYEFFADVWDPTYDNRKKNITIEQLLTHTSGLPNGANGAYPSGSVFTPGQTGAFEYSNDGCNLLTAILNNVTGSNAATFAKQHLFEPMGITDEEWNWWQDSNNISFGGYGFECSPRVQAKIGMLCLNNGTWNGTQLISSKWIREATTYKIDHRWLNLAVTKLYDYGYLFYTDDPYNGYHTYGAGGQVIFVIPDYNITIGFTGSGLDSNLNQVDQWYRHMIDTYILQFTIDSGPGDLIPGFPIMAILLIAGIGIGMYSRIMKKEIRNY